MFNSLKKAGLKGFTMVDISKAFYKSKAEQNARVKNWRQKFSELSENSDQVKVVLLGRPYTVLSETMNNNIPDIFAQKGVRTFYQNMMDVKENDIDTIRDILDSTKWKYAAAILASADKVARTKDLYPVFITSFKCSTH